MKIRMKYLKTFEDYTPVEYVDPKKPHSSYKDDVKDKKKKKSGKIGVINTLQNAVKNILLMKSKY